jgi:membrane protein YdbS with pleckstrin-like domain
MSQHVERATAWIYRGLWLILVNWFHVPDRPPTLPLSGGEPPESFRPAEGFLRYLKFIFWFFALLIDGALFAGLLGITIALPWLGAVLAFPFLALAVVPDVVAYIAIHLRYDSTWYVMTKRSLRIRRGIWIIHETTITFENVQNVEVRQGPLQRFFGIADVLVDTAGGGGKSKSHQGGGTAGHRGLIEGISDAHRVRDLILSRLQRSTSAGLGDEAAHGDHRPAWTAEHVAVLREIRDLVNSQPAS